MEPIGEAVLVLRTDVKEYIASLEDAKKRAEEFQQRLDKMSAAASNTVKPLSDAASNVNTFGRNTEDAGKKADGAGAKVDPFGKKLDKLGSLSEQASIALGTLNSRLQSMAFAAVFTAIGVAIPKIMQWLGATRDLSQEIGNANSNLFSLTRAVNPLVSESESLAKAQFELANIKLFLAQATAQETREEILATIARLDSLTVIQRLKIALLSLTDAGLGEGLAQEEAEKAAKENKNTIKELRAELKLMDELLKVNIPSWDAFKIMLRGVKEEMVFDVRQPFDVMEAELEDFQKRMDQKTQTGSLFTTDPAELDEEVERQRAHQNKLTEIARQANQTRLDSYADTTSAIASLTDALFVFGGQKSKAMFNLNKLANIANATMATYAAANEALKSPHLPYPANVAAAASVIAAGLANVARISSVRFGSTSAGGGGSTGAASGGTPLRGGLRDSERSGQPMNVTVQVNALDPSSVNWDRISQNIADSLGRHLERGGSTGPVTLNFERA